MVLMNVPLSGLVGLNFNWLLLFVSAPVYTVNATTVESVSDIVIEPVSLFNSKDEEKVKITCEAYYSNGERHGGVDFGVLPQGTPIHATYSGVVVESGWDKNGLGNYVKVKCVINDKTVYISYLL